ncbi:MAG: aminotransferase class III-fold pyridoxal phosphate-dependent enzyme [Nitrosopumilaceae archaeon]|nr:aminotransferase class III-fold pyridoxal phosphate-dependent enzyme [Nitrosopumilaceae archaeon]
MYDDDVDLYKKHTQNSHNLFNKSLKQHVNGVSHNIRYFKPYPFVTKYSTGKYIIDVDKNKYIDFWMGHWSLILGHTNKTVTKNITKQVSQGWMYGTVNEQTIKLSEIITNTVPIAEKIRYVTTGTEAAMYAVRLARTITGKKIIAKIDGGWHGYTTDLLKAINWPFSESESNGLINEKYIISLPLNNLEASLDILKTVKNNLACIIIEPVLGGGGCIPATKEYLKGLQEFSSRNDSLFILDEIVTGFRFRFGCIYTELDLKPDIVLLGKIVGGGLPIGIICGKKEVMNRSNTISNEKSKRAYIGGGTFSTNPLTMVSGYHTLAMLKNKQIIYDKINKLGMKTRYLLNKTFGNRAAITGKGSLFMVHFLQNDISHITNAADASGCNKRLLYKYHFRLISNNKIFFLPGKQGALSYAHSNEDVKHLINATIKFIEVFRLQSK